MKLKKGQQEEWKMKNYKIGFIALMSLSLLALSSSNGYSKGAKDVEKVEKTKICHIDSADKTRGKVLTVSQSAAKAHLNHGDPVTFVAYEDNSCKLLNESHDATTEETRDSAQTANEPTSDPYCGGMQVEYQSLYDQYQILQAEYNSFANQTPITTMNFGQAPNVDCQSIGAALEKLNSDYQALMIKFQMLQSGQTMP